ncbi:MAG: type IV pilus secretin PilQ, partial [Polyangiales bacterium]
MRRHALALALAAACLGHASSAHADRPRTLPTTRIDLSVHEADIRNVLRLFAEVGDVDIVYGDGVTGTVTLRLRGVPWDRALAAILRTKGLDMQWDG